MDARKLPHHPSLEQYKKQAKELLKHHESNRPAALKRITQNHPRFADSPDVKPEGAKFSLADAQLVIAREHGFESWPKFAKHIEGLVRSDSPVSRFEAAVDAVVTGELATLERLLRENPGLVRERSTFRHRATLLNYVGANGVENYRQKTPKNAVQIAELLLRAGADINAEADIYHGSDTLGLAATSVWPYLAGVQNALMDTLLQHGANIHEPRLVNACLANGRGAAAEHLAQRGAPLDLEGAAGVGRLDLVKNFFNEDGSLKPNATQRQMELGFGWACEYGHVETVEFLLATGLKVDAMPHGETGLHWAAFTANVVLVKLLLEKKAPLNIKDTRHRGTPLDWALYGWCNLPPEPKVEPQNYYEAVSLLIGAGAKLDPKWLPNLIEKVRGDPRMMAALKNEIPAQ